MFYIFSKWQKEIEDLEQKLMDKQEVIKQYEANCAETEAELANLKVKCAELDRVRIELEEENKKLKELVEEYRKKTENEIGTIIDEFINGGPNDRMEVQTWGAR